MNRRPYLQPVATGLQWAVHLFALAPLVWLLWAIPKGVLGADPVKELIHFLGMGALRLLMLSLLVAPVVQRWRLGPLMRLRRPLGLWCFTWASLHFATWITLDLGMQWQLIGEELIKRTYIVVGFSAWLLLLALAVTSIPPVLRSMGKYWKKLHAWVYLVLVLSCLHFWWAVKSGWLEPGIYAFIGLALLWPRRGKIVQRLPILGSRTTRSAGSSRG